MRRVTHGPCPSCGSRDNLATWQEDGHSHCFGCGHYIPGHTLLVERLSPQIKEMRSKRSLPNDLVPVMSTSNKGAAWLLRYLPPDSVLNDETLPWFWSEKNQWLVSYFPDIDEWSARNFANNDSPKYIESPNLKKSLIYKPYGSSYEWLPSCYSHEIHQWVVVVEDLVSAYKVSQVTNAIPLFGCTLSKTIRDKIRAADDIPHNLIFWYDPNKKDNAFADALAYMPYGKVRIITKHNVDPKQQGLENIYDFITEAVK